MRAWSRAFASRVSFSCRDARPVRDLERGDPFTSTAVGNDSGGGEKREEGLRLYVSLRQGPRRIQKRSPGNRALSAQRHRCANPHQDHVGKKIGEIPCRRSGLGLLELSDTPPTG